MPLTVIFVRHGESTANVEHIFANRPEIHGDLTPAGIGQAETLARSLEGAGLTHIFSSPLPRAMQTANIVAGHLTLPVTISDALREYDVGEDEGFPYTGNDAWRWDRYEKVQRAWRSGDRSAAHPGGETLADIELRLGGFLEVIAAEQAEGDVILAVGHGGIYHAAMPALFPSLPDDIAHASPLGHADQVVVEIHDRTWRCIRWSSVILPREER